MAINNKFIRTYDDDARVVMLKGVRLSFTESLKDKKASIENGPLKHSCNILIENDQPGYEEKKQAIVAAMKAACVQKKKPEEFYKEIATDNPSRVSYRKGERFKNKQTREVYAGYADNWAIAGSGPSAGQKRPVLYSRNKRKLGAPGQQECFTVDDIPDIFYSGTYADVKVSMYYTDKGGDGLFATIESIRSLETGERMSGGGVTTTADEYDDAEDDDAFDGASGSSSDDDFD